MYWFVPACVGYWSIVHVCAQYMQIRTRTDKYRILTQYELILFNTHQSIHAQIAYSCSDCICVRLQLPGTKPVVVGTFCWAFICMNFVRIFMYLIRICIYLHLFPPANTTGVAYIGNSSGAIVRSTYKPQYFPIMRPDFWPLGWHL